MTDPLTEIDEWGPEKIVVVSDARTGMKGVLVIDNTARGMGKGGTRMGPGVSVAEIARLARVMTWKWAGVDMFFGGAKAGIVGDPNAADKEDILRAFARKLSNEVPREYVLGLDMGLNEYDAAILADELGDRGAAVGSPAELGGVPYDQLGVTGFGVVESAHVAADRLGLALSASTVSIQGFGAVGTAAARRFTEYGATVVAISTSAGALHDPAGLDVEELLTLASRWGDDAVRHYRGQPVLPVGAELTVACDVLVPAARQDTIDGPTAGEVKAKLVVEGANLPASQQALEVLAERKILVIPDFVANAGGIVAAGVAMEARYSPFRPDPDAILTLVAKRIRANTADVLDESDATAALPHDAARSIAQSRVRAAMTARGQIRSELTA
ncbi:Glu/Leu/Phe/Val family dehydrogenase [Mycolicibacterium komossense]|uniref:Glutamate dehydrogenase n=1 Tax=Mycolicibacterium komossense TaxID=1779 RepID=A0ABT3CKN6_9MYCO|nr:Glu/Leu/Phe/Val dehydrogenase dimerization domain-containing protein [Mycolicibacterium komossense]MCV7230049.1 Glu/Leu/Phe/Val dehydrogenase [Mycolicibacterium komossense]